MPRDNRFANGKMLSVLLDWTLLPLSAATTGILFAWLRWAGGDIGVLRVANVTLTMALGWILSFLVIRRFWKRGGELTEDQDLPTRSRSRASFHRTKWT